MIVKSCLCIIRGRNLGSASKRSVNHLEIYIRRISTNFSLRVWWYSFAQTRVQSVYNSVQWIDRWRDLLITLRPPSFLISQNFWTRLPKKISKSEVVETLLEEGVEIWIKHPSPFTLAEDSPIFHHSTWRESLADIRWQPVLVIGAYSRDTYKARRRERFGENKR